MNLFCSARQEVTEQIKVFMNMREVMSQVSRGGASSMMGTLFGGGAGLANLANMMQARTGGAASSFANRGISHQEASSRANEKARKEAKRKAEKAARKKNRRH